MTVQKEIEALVKHIATRAVEKDTPFAEAVDALKAITGFLAMQGKRKGKSGDEPPTNEPSFDTFRNELEEITNGEKARRAGLKQ